MGAPEAVSAPHEPERLNVGLVRWVIRRYFPALWRDEARRDDAIQEGWLAMERARQGFDASRADSLRGFAATRIRYHLLDWLRAERGGRRKQPLTFVALPRSLRHDSGEDRILERIDNERAWARWSPRERDVAWALASGYTNREIGARWGVSHQAVSLVRGAARRKAASLSPAGVSP